MSYVSRYPEDPTGIRSANLVSDEPHTLSAQTYRVLTPQYGLFYGQGLVVKTASNQILTPSVQYRPINLNAFATSQFGQEVYANILILDTALPAEIRVTYHAVGGAYERDSSIIGDLIEATLRDTRPVQWPNILNKPETFDYASPHLHPLTDGVGFEHMVLALDALRSAVLMGDQIYLDQVITYIQNQIDGIRAVAETGQDNALQMATARAYAASNAMEQASLQVNDLWTQLQAMVVKQNTLMAQIEAFENNQKAQPYLAKQIIASIPLMTQNGGGLVQCRARPPNYLVDAMVYDLPTTGYVYSDQHKTTSDGRCLYGTDASVVDVALSDAVTSTSLRAYVGEYDHVCKLILTMKSIDHRDYQLNGAYAEGLITSVAPVQFLTANEFPRTVFSTSGTLTWVRDSLHDPETPMYAVGKDSTDWIDIGVDGATYAQYIQIAEALLDFRAENNILQYGVTQRDIVRFKIPRGVSLTLSMDINAENLNEWKQGVYLPIHHALRVISSTLVSGQIVLTVIKDHPDRDQFRALSVHF